MTVQQDLVNEFKQAWATIKKPIRDIFFGTPSPATAAKRARSYRNRQDSINEFPIPEAIVFEKGKKITKYTIKENSLQESTAQQHQPQNNEQPSNVYHNNQTTAAEIVSGRKMKKQNPQLNETTQPETIAEETNERPPAMTNHQPDHKIMHPQEYPSPISPI